MLLLESLKLDSEYDMSLEEDQIFDIDDGADFEVCDNEDLYEDESAWSGVSFEMEEEKAYLLDWDDLSEDITAVVDIITCECSSETIETGSLADFEDSIETDASVLVKPASLILAKEDAHPDQVPHDQHSAILELIVDIVYLGIRYNSTS